jgi:hypothetical protein
MRSVRTRRLKPVKNTLKTNPNVNNQNAHVGGKPLIWVVLGGCAAMVNAK